MNEDFAWFQEHYADFQKKYGNAFLAIKNKKILGVYATYADGVRETAKAEPIGTFIIQECNAHTEAYHCYISSMNFA